MKKGRKRKKKMSIGSHVGRDQSVQPVKDSKLMLNAEHVHGCTTQSYRKRKRMNIVLGS